ncbi:class I SAM-dependent methyltransferase, partial [Pseudomonadota bacterium]
GSVPDIYGDALKLPVKDESIHTVLLIDVLEHISDTNRLLWEIYRALEPDGRLIMQVPFLYPLHDEPRDYVRLTIHGYRELARKSGFLLEKYNSMGHPVETSTMLINIAMSKTVLEWLKDKNPAAIFVIILPVFVLFSNLLARLISILSKEDSFMPYSYQLTFRKESKEIN